jgi:hypothetical protein
MFTSNLSRAFNFLDLLSTVRRRKIWNVIFLFFFWVHEVFHVPARPHVIDSGLFICFLFYYFFKLYLSTN